MARLGRHDGRLRDLLLVFKYGGRDELDRSFGRKLADALLATDWLDQVEALVAVPTCWHRCVLGRPYVATALARETARAANLPNLTLLRRVKRQRSQIGLTYPQRLKNVRGAFRLARSVKLDKAVICLVDDVATTGATLSECARVLKRAGAAKVYGAVVCRQEGSLGA
jgi:ComF family protein